jgi:hypothetical protein
MRIVANSIPKSGTRLLVLLYTVRPSVSCA